jgi:hypothetical protein
LAAVSIRVGAMVLPGKLGGRVGRRETLHERRHLRVAPFVRLRASKPLARPARRNSGNAVTAAAHRDVRGWRPAPDGRSMMRRAVVFLGVVVLVVLALALLAGPAGAATAIEYGLIAG